MLRPFAEVRLLEARQRDARPVTDRRSLLERHAGRLVRERAALPDADVLGVRAVPLHAEDLVADRELG